jgi:hypothetical protein
MKKNSIRLLWYLPILLAAAIFLVLPWAAGLADEPAAGAPVGEHQTVIKKPEGMSEMFQGTVAEVIQAGRHIYVRIDTGKQQIWVAVPVFDGKPGDNVLVPPGVPFVNFKSRKLNRTFKMIIFVGSIHRVDE